MLDGKTASLRKTYKAQKEATKYGSLERKHREGDDTAGKDVREKYENVNIEMVDVDHEVEEKS